LPQVSQTPAPVLEPTKVATPRPAAAATATQARVTPPAAPPAPGQVFADRSLGISFAYPRDWDNLPRAPDEPPGVTLRGPAFGEGSEPIIFAITVDVQPVSEQTVREVVDQQLAQVPDDLRAGIQRRTLMVGGEPAEEVIGLPSRAGAVEAFILHQGQLYLIILQPYDENNASLQPYLSQVRAAYDGLLASWKFLK
jgi:hypothetical protein